MGNNASFDKFKGNRMEFLQLSCCNIYLLEIHVSARSQKWEILESNRRKGHVVSGSVWVPVTNQSVLSEGAVPTSSKWRPHSIDWDS